MSGPAQHGALIFAQEVKTLANFYQQVCDLRFVHERNDLIVLTLGEANQLVIAQSPVPPLVVNGLDDEVNVRDCAIKLFFTIDDYRMTKQKIKALNGRIIGSVIKRPFFNVVDVADCEGNVFHLRFTQ